MLSDRPYMRDDYEDRSPFSALTWLICVIVGGFVVENIFLRWIGGGAAQKFFDLVTLSPRGVSSGFVWTFFTHALVHDPASLLGLALTLLMLVVFGRQVLPSLGAKRFWAVFVASIAAGGLAWLGFNWSSGQHLFGASAGVSALVVVFACLSPNQPISFFMLDIGMRAKHLAIGLAIIEAVGLVLLELPGRASWFEMPHSAHLGGMLAGWLYMRWLHNREHGLFSSSKPSVELPRWFRKARQSGASAPASFKVDLEQPEDMRAEIDRILDKINSDGFQSLTPEEKRRLDLARDHLSRR